jgi:hypothetical protein
MPKTATEPVAKVPVNEVPVTEAEEDNSIPLTGKRCPNGYHAITVNGTKRCRPNTNGKTKLAITTAKVNTPTKANTATINTGHIQSVKAKELTNDNTAIIIPFRDTDKGVRTAQLTAFIDYMTNTFFADRYSGYKIFVIEQSDDKRKFNRGKLLNIGYQLATQYGYNYCIFHDVDLLPSMDLLPWYTDGPKDHTVNHIAHVWKDRYSGSSSYLGGVTGMSSATFAAANGYPNNYWGWGGEDDELRDRLNHIHATIRTPTQGGFRDLEQMNLKEKQQYLKQRTNVMNLIKTELRAEHAATWKTNGLADQDYNRRWTTVVNAEHWTHIRVDIKNNGDHWSNAKNGQHDVAWGK